MCDYLTTVAEMCTHQHTHTHVFIYKYRCIIVIINICKKKTCFCNNMRHRAFTKSCRKLKMLYKNHKKATIFKCGVAVYENASICLTIGYTLIKAVKQLKINFGSIEHTLCSYHIYVFVLPLALPLQLCAQCTCVNI